MASTIQIKNSNTAGNSPSALTQGELAINVADGNLFYGDGSSVLQRFALTQLTASGDISASGNVYAAEFHGDGSNLTGVGTVDTSGTPADNQIAVFTDSNTIEGTTKVTVPSTSILSIQSSNNDAGAVRLFGGAVGSSSPYITPYGSHTTLKFGDGTSGHNFDLQNNKLVFDQDSTNTYIYADTSTPESLEIHADQDIELRADRTVNIESSLNSGDVVKIENTTTSPMSFDHYALRVIGGQAIGTPGGQTKAYAGHFTAGNTNGTNPDSIALFAQGHEDGAPNSYAAIFSGSAGGVVGINTLEPTVELDVVGTISSTKNKLAKTSATVADHQGDVVFFGSTTSMDNGKIYYYNSSGGWTIANADALADSKGLLAVALGGDSDTDGMLIRGMVTLDHDPGAVADVLYLSTTDGQVSSTAPSGNNHVVRTLGYCLDASNGQIYFNPSNDFIVITA